MAAYEDKLVRLSQLVTKAEQSYEYAKRAAAARGATPTVRHKCFIAYHGADIDGVTEFVEEYNDVFIPRILGVSDSDHFKDPVNSTDEDYIKSEIGSKYLSDSTVTILYAGRCTWARKYVDWEISSSLRADPINKRNGLLGITPKDRTVNTLPARFADNWDGDDKYARYKYYPQSSTKLRAWIEDAFKARTQRSSLVVNSRALRRFNSEC